MPVTVHGSANTDRGNGDLSSDFRRQWLDHALQYNRKSPRVADGLRILFVTAPAVFDPALCLESSHGVAGLWGEADMGHDGNSALDQKFDGLSHALAAFDLHRSAAGFLHDPGCIAKGHLGAFLIGAERHIHHYQRAFCAGHNGLAMHNHEIERHPKGAVHPMHDHAQAVPDQDEICIAIYNGCRMGVIAG